MAFELPEAFTLAAQMQPVLAGRTLVRQQLGPACASLIRQGFVNLDQVDLAGRRVQSVHSQGKWIFTLLEPDIYLLIALESGGRVLYFAPGQPPPEKFHLRLDFDDGAELVVQVVGWGFIKAAGLAEVESLAYPGKLGLSPIDPQAFTLEAFQEILAGWPNKSLKFVLLQQRQVAGIGNGYAQEILYRAKLHPKRKAASLSATEQERLHGVIVATLCEAVEAGGSHLEVDLFGRPGGYVRRMGGHLLGQPCPACGTPVEKLALDGAAVYLCPTCQPFERQER